MNSAIFGLAKPESLAFSSVAGSGAIGPSFLREGIGDFRAVFRHHHRRGIDATAPAVVGDGASHHINEFRPALDFIFADQNFAEARAVNLDGRIVGVLVRRVLVAENQRPSAGLQNLPRAFVVGRIKTKRFRRTTRGDERLDQAITASTALRGPA